MEKLRILVNTQTPLVQFSPPSPDKPDFPKDVELSALRQDVDYRFSPGGVTRMVYPLLQRFLAEGFIESADWVSLNPRAPATVRLPGITLHNVGLDPSRMKGYGATKETIWAAAHGLGEPERASGLFWTDEFAEYAFYNRTTAERILSLDRERDFDLFYIHDFQQLPVGHMLATLKPKIFRWHIPFEVGRIPASWRAPFETYLQAYDTIVVSSERHRKALAGLGRSGSIVLLHPYVDPKEYARPEPSEVRAAAQKFGLRPSDQVVLVVARMDPTKAQDVAIRAVAILKERFPHLRLVLAGNGSFSGASGGPGPSKAEAWHRHLKETAERLGVADRVVFTGHVTQAELDALYDRCLFTVLPSVNEGFGLVVVESWLHRRATLVTKRAGISDLIEEGHDGLTFDPEDAEALARLMERLLKDSGRMRRALAEAGHRTARRCSIETAVTAETALLTRAVEG